MQCNDVTEYLKIYDDLKFNEGGHFNHEFFWKSLAPISNGGGKMPDKVILGSPLTKVITDTFGSNDMMIYEFNDKAMKFTGAAGWGWLVYNTKTKELEV